MRNGVYSVSFSAAGAAGTGVAVVNNGIIQGGDAGFIYRGHLKREGETLNASIHVLQHAAGHPSVFGALTDFELNLSGKSSGDTFSLAGTVAGREQLRISIRGQFKVDLLT